MKFSSERQRRAVMAKLKGRSLGPGVEAGSMPHDMGWMRMTGSYWVEHPYFGSCTTPERAREAIRRAEERQPDQFAGRSWYIQWMGGQDFRVYVKV